MAKSKKFLIVAILFLFSASIVVTILENQFAIELLAPITIILVFILMLSNVRKMGPYKFSSSFIALGFLCLAIGDIYRFVNHYVLDIHPYSDLVRFIYVMPTFFFAINESIYLWLKLKSQKRALFHLFANTFTGSIIGYVLIYKLLTEATGGLTTLVQYSYLGFAFFAFFVCMMCIQTFYLVGAKNLFKETNIITVALIIYEIMDLDYVYTESIGYEPDNNFGDLVYLFCIILITLSVTIQIQKKYVFEFRQISHDHRSNMIRTIIAISGIGLTLFAGVTGILTRNEASNIIIVLMSYIIMFNMLHSSEVHEKQAATLEKMVTEKTSELKSLNEKLELMSSTDALTGLYNKRFREIFLDNISSISGKRYALICADLNMFKPVNDTYGHEMGDRVLHEFGKRMKNLPAEYDSFRTGGDEFLIIKKLDEHETDLTDVAKTIQKVFDTAIIYDTYIFNLSASLGISIYPDDSTDIRDVMQYADTAMYAVKHSENKDDYKFFSKDLIHLLSLQQSIRERLKEAVPKRDFTIYYQPQIDTTSGEIIGFEAFPHIKGDMEYLSPSEIIPVAEEVGIMSSLGLWLVTTALSQVKEWEKIGHKEYSLTVNLSPLQLIDNNYFEPLKDYMDKEDIEHSSLILDIANSVIMGSASSAKKCMKALHDEGFMLSLNDFGGDDINLSYVLECGFNGIKLSRSLIAELGTDTRSKILIDSIMALSENMKIDVTAVGVETKDQENALKDLGITKVQGYLYYKPVTADEIEKIISK